MAIITTDKGYTIFHVNSEDGEWIEVGKWDQCPIGHGDLVAFASTLGEARLFAKQYQSKHQSLGITLR